VAKGLRWRLFIDTAAESPHDIYPELDGPPPVTGALALLDRSLRCYVAEREPIVTKVK
jgi:glycogen operon protein